MSNERKLVEALRAFMERGVIPCLPDNHPALNEWRFLSGILASEPTDYAQIDFYLLMANKSSPQPPPLAKTNSQIQNVNSELEAYNRLTGSEYSPAVKRSGVGVGNKR